MGWCGATIIFDTIVGELLKNSIDTKDVITKIAKQLESYDWDCQMESDYWDHPIVQKIFKELHPSWFEEK